MAEEQEGHAKIPPEEGEEQHPLPAATILPAGFAVGVAILLVGTVFSWPVFGIGVGIAVVFGFLWARELVRGGRPVRVVEAVPAEAEEEEEEAEEPARYGRDKFLELTTLGLGALIGGVVTVPVVGFAIAPSFIGQSDEDIDLGPISNFSEGTFVVATFLSQKEEGQVSSRTAFVRNNGIANGVPSFTILSNRCTHLGCPIQPNGPTQEAQQIQTSAGNVTLIPSQPAGFGCPCHAGAYDTEGNRTAGPPVRALDRYQYKIVNGSLVLSDRYSVGKVVGEGASAKIESYTRYDPGQHVDGPDEWMYPISPRGV